MQRGPPCKQQAWRLLATLTLVPNAYCHNPFDQ